MTNDFIARRRELLACAFLVQLPLGACAMTDKPVLRGGIGQWVEEIEKQSTLRPLQIGIVNSPHRIEYKDERLELTLPDCGAQISMPTTISVHEGRLDMIGSASVLGDYVDIREAVHHVGLRLKEVLAQGFGWVNSPFARFAEIANANPIGTRVPESAGSLEGVVDYFVSPQWLIQEINAFSLVKDGLEVGLRLKNMRRSFPTGDESWKDPNAAAAKFDRQLTPTQRLSEKAYYLEMSFVKEWSRRPQRN